VCYLDAVRETHRTKSGERTKGNLATIDTQGRVLWCIARELKRRGA
jgi:hypothetical protein